MKNKKLIVTLLLTGCIFMLCACGNNSTNDSNKEKQAISSETEDMADNEKDNETTDQNAKNITSEEKENDNLLETSNSEDSEKEENVEGQITDATEKEFSFKDLEEQIFIFSSGVGGWETNVKIDENGNFEGYYSDCDMGDMGVEYPDGTWYYCSFTGTFSKPKKINKYVYEVKLESLSQQDKENEESIKDGARYISSVPYGIEGGKTFEIYLPDVSVDTLPEGYLSWVQMDMEEGCDKLPFYGLYNVEQENGFSSVNYGNESSDEDEELIFDNLDNTELDADVKQDISKINNDTIKAEVEETEKKAAIIISKINNEPLDQATMNSLSWKQYKLWDDELNSMWARLKEKLSSEEMEKLRIEEKEWIDFKEQKVTEAGMDAEGGSLQPLLENGENATLTRKRVYELAKYFE